MSLNFQQVTKDSHDSNILWSLARQMNTSEQSISSLTGFNMQARDDIVVTKDTVGYLPTAMCLTQALMIQNTLDLDDIVCVFDQALYAKTAEITW